MQHNPRFLAFVNEVRQRVNEVDVQQVKRWMEQNRPFVLVDVREESKWAIVMLSAWMVAIEVGWNQVIQSKKISENPETSIRLHDKVYRQA